MSVSDARRAEGCLAAAGAALSAGQRGDAWRYLLEAETAVGAVLRGGRGAYGQKSYATGGPDDSAYTASLAEEMDREDQERKPRRLNYNQVGDLRLASDFFRSFAEHPAVLDKTERRLLHFHARQLHEVHARHNSDRLRVLHPDHLPRLVDAHDFLSDFASHPAFGNHRDQVRDHCRRLKAIVAHAVAHLRPEDARRVINRQPTREEEATRVAGKALSDIEYFTGRLAARHRREQRRQAALERARRRDAARGR